MKLDLIQLKEPPGVFNVILELILPPILALVLIVWKVTSVVVQLRQSVRLDSTLLKAVLNVLAVKRGRSPALLDRVFVPSAGRVTSAVRVLRLLAEWATIRV